MHTKDALAAGEDPQRLSLVAAWREATVFTETGAGGPRGHRAGHRIADAAGGVAADAWQTPSKHYDDEQLAALTLPRSPSVNAFNRLNVINQQPAGGYVPGQFAG